MKSYRTLFSMILCLLVFHLPCSAGKISFIDAGNTPVTIDKLPGQVVSLVPSITEIIFALGAEDVVRGITYHSAQLENAAGRTIVGGYFHPSVNAVEALDPDLVFVSSIHRDIKPLLAAKKRAVVETAITSVSQSLETIQLLGRIFDREKEAAGLVAAIKADNDLIAKKVARIAPEKRKRVMRLMGRNTVMTPGKDSFQNEMIRLAGGIPPDLDRPGQMVEMTEEEWIRFNPQVVYGCGEDRELWERIADSQGWEQVDAVKNNRFYSFPCDLTCRAATHTGDFVKWLSATLYPDRFASPSFLMLDEGISGSTPLSMNIDCIGETKILESRILDFTNRTLILDFKTPMTVLSTLEGWKTGVTTAGNHYTPPQSWLMDHSQGLDSFRNRVLTTLDLTPQQTAMLFTGADMTHLAVKRETFKDLSVWALVTAGVESNAMRAGRDKGLFYEPGTINTILITNMQLSSRAMTRSIVTATEAKTAALMDLDIRTSYNDGAYRATGTGTDNVLVVQGTGQTLDNAGGHTRLGELIARAVTRGVKKAVARQNGVTRDLDVFNRLKKRGITIHGVLNLQQCDCGRTKSGFAGAVEHLLLDKRYQGFMETAFSVSDDFEKGLVKDLSAFETLAVTMARQISGKPVDSLKPLVKDPEVPRVLSTALNALFNGVYHRGIEQP
ncbi:MAG: helical backbone metal receptor [Desulfobacteraceae bacterium]